LLSVLSGALVRVAGAQIVTCYSSFDKRTGECSGLLGDGVDQDDCCLNQAYGFINDSGACQSCGPATWSEWSSWGACTVTCLEGVKQRRRRCDGVGECPGNSAVLETKSCSDQDCCPGSGGWTDWGSWQPCSVTCKSGTKVRRRSCTAPPPSCGGSCYGTDTETASCDTFQECPIHGGWSAWGAWGKCSGSCIWEQPRFVPTRTRIRTCTNPAPSLSPPGRPCGGQTEEQEDCSSLPFCPVDGGWSQWSPSGSCSVTCGLGLRQMTRQCNSPAPKHNGRPCVGSTTSNALCNTATHCPADGQWSEWTEWTLCSRAGRKIDCKRTGGTQRRTRVCKGQAFGGNPCPEDYSESRACYYLKDCISE
ncbi:PROP protein, partial [Amia calva]|nr:PROP protein [Amia calva]